MVEAFFLLPYILFYILFGLRPVQCVCLLENKKNVMPLNFAKILLPLFFRRENMVLL